MNAAEGGGWAVVLVCGVLWGCALAAIETLSEPPVGLPLPLVAEFMVGMLVVWSLNGVCWAVATRLAGRRLPRFAMVLLWLIGTGLLSAVQAALNVTHAVLTIGAGMRTVLGPHVPFDALYAHVLWLNAVFGGFYVVAYRAFLHAMHSRRQLARLQLALNEEATQLQEARLTTLRGALQPQVLLETVQVLRTRYETDPLAADALLDRLVTYLRAAIGASGAEFKNGPVAEAYVKLRRALSEPVFEP